MLPLGAIAPWALGAASAAFGLLDLSAVDMVSPVDCESESPKTDLATLRHRLAEWSLGPLFRKAAARTPPSMTYDDVQTTYNYNLAKIDFAEAWLAARTRWTGDLRLCLKFAAISLLPGFGYSTSALYGIVPSEWSAVVVGASVLAFGVFFGATLYILIAIRGARSAYEGLVGAVRLYLSLAQTLPAEGAGP